MLKGEDVVKSIGEGLRGLIIDIGKAIIKMVVLKTISSIVPGLGALIPFRASGGAVSGGSPYVVGERGPELMVPNTSGSAFRSQRTLSPCPPGSRTLALPAARRSRPIPRPDVRYSAAFSA